MPKGNEEPPYDTKLEKSGTVSPAEVRSLEAELLELNGMQLPEENRVSTKEPLTDSASNLGKAEAGYYGSEDAKSEKEQEKLDTWTEAWQDFCNTYDGTVKKLATREELGALRTKYGEYSKTLEVVDVAVKRAKDLSAEGTITIQRLQEDEELAEIMGQFYDDYVNLWHKSSIIERMREEEEGREGKTVADLLEGVPDSYKTDGGLAQALQETCKDTKWLTQGFDVMRVEQAPRGEVGPATKEKQAPKDTKKNEICVTVETGANVEVVAKAVRRKVAERNNWDNAPTLTLEERAQFLEEVAELFGRDVHVQPQWDGDVSEELVEGESTHKHAALNLEMYWKTLNDLFDTDQLEKGDEKNLVMRWRDKILLNEEEVAGETDEAALPGEDVSEDAQSKIDSNT